MKKHLKRDAFSISILKEASYLCFLNLFRFSNSSTNPMACSNYSYFLSEQSGNHMTDL